MTDRHPPKHLILADGDFGPMTSKTANSIIRFQPDRVVGVLDRTTAESPTLTGVKEYQTDDDTNVTLRLQTSCADNSDGTTTVYATAMREVNIVQAEKQHRSAGIGWATVTVPAGSARILRPQSRETVQDPDFYKRFYALVSKYAEEDARTAR